MVKKWMICVNSKGASTLDENVKYLVECRGKKAKVIIREGNRHHIYGNIVNMSRFKSIKPKPVSYHGQSQR